MSYSAVLGDWWKWREAGSLHGQASPSSGHRETGPGVTTSSRGPVLLPLFFAAPPPAEGALRRGGAVVGVAPNGTFCMTPRRVMAPGHMLLALWGTLPQRPPTTAGCLAVLEPVLVDLGTAFVPCPPNRSPHVSVSPYVCEDSTSHAADDPGGLERPLFGLCLPNSWPPGRV